MALLIVNISVFILCAVLNSYSGSPIYSSSECGMKVTIDVEGGEEQDSKVVNGSHISNALEELTNRTRDLETAMQSLQHLLNYTDTNCSVAFTARKKEPETLSESDLVVRFEDVYLNLGSGYNPETGRFTAPSDGTYVFSWTITTEHCLATGAMIVVDGNEVARSWADSREVKEEQDDSSSATVVVVLQRDSEVYIQLKPNFGSLFVDGNKWSSFAGWKVGCK